jgi:Flp pilus assembly protein TadG
MAALKAGVKWRIARSERGAELIEFALVLPLLLLLVLGIVDFGFLFQRLEVVTNAAREGARIAVLPGYTTNDIKDRVNDYLEDGGVPIVRGTNPVITVNPVTITTSPGGATINSEQVQVRYSHSYLFLSGFARFFGGSFDSVPLTGQATMRIEAGGS